MKTMKLPIALSMRNTGARGLCSIVENVLMDTMFTLSDETVEEVYYHRAVC